MKPTSFSQNMLFSKCPRSWFFQYIKKIPVIQDMSYAIAGNVLHKTIEHYYKTGKSIQELKVSFEEEWLRKKLDKSFLNPKKDTYWLMVINAVNLNLILTSNELKMFYPDAVGYLDGVNTNDDLICDWKSSTRRPENEEEYTTQLLYYSMLYKRKFDRLPKKATVYYLKYSGSKGELSITPTEDDIKGIEKWHNDIREQINKIRESQEMPSRCKNCFMFCGFKNHCGDNENVLKYNLVITGNYINVEGLVTPLLEKGFNKKFSYELKDAYWIKKNNPYANTIVNFWNNKKQIIPLAFKDGVVKTLTDYGEYTKKPIAIDINDMRVFNDTKIDMPDKLIGKELRDYQTEAVEEFMRKKISLLQIGTGGGKTEILIECIRRLCYKTLFVVDKIELLRQTKKRIEDSLGIEVGQIGGGKEDIKHVTVATIQTLNKRGNLYNDYLKSIRFGILDECHKVAATSYRKLSNKLLNTEYRAGVSATAKRDDGNDMMITSVCGYKCFNLSSSELVKRGWLVKPKIIFVKKYIDKEETKELEKKSKKGLINESDDYPSLYEELIVNNKKRNELIKKITKDNKDKKILILVKLIKHGNLLCGILEGSRYLHGSTNKDEREEMFKEFSTGKLNVLISTISIFAEGIDIPALDMVINASANAGDIKTIQVLGRVLRKMEGKENAYYYDFQDEGRFFSRASHSRIKSLIDEGHDVDIEKYKNQ